MNPENTPDASPKSNDSGRKCPLNDPVGSHMVQLRTYYRELHENVCRIEQAIKNIRDGEPVNTKEVFLAPPSIPELPEEFPFRKPSAASSRTRPKLIVEGCLSEDEAKLQRMSFVKNVLIQSGFHESEPDALLYLTDITDNFLCTFSETMNCHIRSNDFESGDIMSPLETTLQNISFGGIFGLYTFYQEILRKHGVLLDDCQELYDRYEKLLEDLKKCQPECSTSGKSNKKSRTE